MPLKFSWLSDLAGLSAHIDPACAATPAGWARITVKFGALRASVDLLSRQTRAEEIGIIPARSLRVGPARASVTVGGLDLVNRVLLDLMTMRPADAASPEALLRRQLPWLDLRMQHPILPGANRFIIRAPRWWPNRVAEQVRSIVAAQLGQPVHLA